MDYFDHPLYAAHYDLVCGCDQNKVRYEDFAAVELELTGENDGPEWHWIVRTESGHAYVHGGCDYTGWDCQSHAERHDAATLDGALALVPQDYRRVFEEMRAAGEVRRKNTM